MSIKTSSWISNDRVNLTKAISEEAIPVEYEMLFSLQFAFKHQPKKSDKYTSGIFLCLV